MKSIVRILLTALAVVILAKVLPGVTVEGYLSAVIVAIVIALLRFIVKPILVILTLPITIITLGLFLLFVNGMVILLADLFIGDFEVRNIWWAILFSLLLSILQSIFHSILDDKKK